ncbi:DUF1501 domain-containing protein [Dinghuibacter silviterrae]|uniref:Putative secreted protein (Por secretion system target) n=1 Tax=Dinghuibacter silviterrae TaxID=1539049 RepID=A0A4R8DVA9_9BACT|nr:DUF1501 domain-containing protein [Dinghuibacter silviterrae]TDX01946.1 putative secreted protein (Por secretion system target) [Dinghuibacter silviterrae]
MKRRTFLKTTAPMAAVFPALLGGFPIKAFAGSIPFFGGWDGAADNDHVLVLIQLFGGNDGLNTVIPIDIYSNYYNLRSNIAIPESAILKLGVNDKSGLHPSLTGLQGLYQNDQLAILQGVCYPSPDESHFRATDIWLTGASSNQYLNTGWVGRFLGETYTNYPVGYPSPSMPDPLAIQIGSVLSPTFMSSGGNTAMAVPEDADFYGLINGLTSPEPDTPMGTEVTYLRTIARQTNKYAGVIKTAYDKVVQQYAGYPANNDLAAQLKTVARLVAGGLKTKVYMVNMGGFDTHGGQVVGGATTTGNHAQLLTQVSEAITAFMKDLKFLGQDKRVLGMTFSEFGRRIVSNGSLGTDHGAGQPVFIFGDAAQTGILGSSPDLPATMDVEAVVPMQYDFRSVYSTILRDWFCVPASDVSTMLLANYQYLPFIQSNACANVITPVLDIGSDLIRVYPSPFLESTDITYKTNGGHTMIQVFDVAGHLITVLVDQVYNGPGTYYVTFNAGYLAAGIYYARLQNESVTQVKTMLKGTK